ncbi:TM0996/MTH895 family glutaredoxin-like protein [bacterium]|nr:TM0996/MTH895 family glutaredoxin-like protein [bacterium]
MKKIFILGAGCFKCNKLHENVEAAIEETGVECEVSKVSDPAAFAEFGVMTSPALIIDGELKAAGRMLSVEQIRKILEE